MHRAGTSALCAALDAAGACFGADLLEPMAGVNDEGFWEAAEVVQINEALLAEAGYQWYTVTPAAADVDWSAQRFDGLRERARTYLGHLGTLPGDVHAIKDPRLCITLPLWLRLAAAEGFATATCLIQRAPMEIARSLQVRDALPTGYGLRLTASYLESALRHAPAGSAFLTYRELLDDPVAAVAPLAGQLPLAPDATALRAAVREDLRHQAEPDEPDVFTGLPGRDGLQEYLACLRRDGESDREMAELASALVDINRALAELGEAHQLALDTIDERDAQITDFDARLQALGREHSRALATIDERDEQLQCLTGKPLLGPLVRVYLRYALR